MFNLCRMANCLSSLLHDGIPMYTMIYKYCTRRYQTVLNNSLKLTTTTSILRPFIWDYSDKLVPEDVHHSHLSQSLITNHLLSTSAIYYNLRHSPCSIYMLDSLFAHLSPSPLWSISGSGTYTSYSIHFFT